MQRVVSIWLPFWRTDRLERRARAGVNLHDATGKPLAVIAKGKGGKRIAGLNPCARQAGLRDGMLLTDACALMPTLTAAPQDMLAERGELKRLAAACNRFSPWTAPDEPDGLWIEATGLAHLFGGEEKLLHLIISRLNASGFAARAAIAGTAGAAWALARFAKTTATLAPAGEEAEAIAALPVKALRLDAEGVRLLERLGLKTIGQLYGIPRASLRARLGKAITCRLDQALGRQGEALSPLMPEPVYAARLEFLDPLTALQGLEETARILIGSVADSLAADGKGARRFALTLFDTQNGKTEIRFQMARPSAEAAHIFRLLREKLTALEGRLDPSLGFDAVTLYALGAEPLLNRQTDILGPALDSGDREEKLARFLDRVSARLGDKAVTQPDFAESYWPERASTHAPAAAAAASASARPARGAAVPSPASLPRPPMLLPHPEPIDVIVRIPDYPPRRFTWRRRPHAVTRAEGPERISPEWWEADKALPARDYYIVEDERGQRFWLYREGIYGRSENQRWFMHGLFP